jgi:hypothetical protein
MSFESWSNEKKKKKEEEQTQKKTVSFDEWSDKKVVNSVDQDYINTFITDANNFFSTVENDYNSIGWGNASSIYSTKFSSWNDLDTRATTISKWLEQNKSGIDPEAYKSLYTTIDSIKGGATSALDAFGKARDYYAQWDTEEAYKAYEKQQTEYKKVTGADDFAEKSQYTSSKRDGFWDKLLGRTEDKTYEYVNNQNDYRAEYNKDYAIKSMDSLNPFADGESKYKERGYDFLTDEEIAIYNYFYSTEGEDRAQEFLDSIEDSLVYRKAGKEFEALEGNTLKEIFYGAVTGIDQFRSGIENLGDFVTGGDGFTSSSQYVSGMIREDLADNGGKIFGNSIGQIGYDLVNTTANMLPSILVGAVTGGAGGAATLGASAVGNAYAEMKSLGYSDGQARGYGFLVGASEATLQYLLGGIGKLGGKVSGKAIGNLISKFDNAIAKTAIKLGGSMMSEGLEESIQTILEPAFKALVTGEDFEAPEWDDILYSGMLGALTAGFMEGAPTIAGTAASNIEAKKIHGDGSDLVSEALGVSTEGSELRTLAEKYQQKLDSGKKLSGEQIRNLDEAIASNDTDLIKKAVLRRLGELGETTDVTPVAEVLAKYATGEELGSKDMAILNNSEKGHIVLAELNKDNIQSGGLGNKWAQNIGTRRINPESYNKDLYDLAKAVAGFKEAVEKESVSKTATEEKSATVTKFEASDGGETIVTSTGENVSVKGVASIKGGTLMLELDNGKTINAKDVSFGSKDDALVYEMVTDMEVSPQTANTLIKGFKAADGVPAEAYKAYIPLAYKYGLMNYKAGLDNLDLTAEQKNTAFVLGRDEAKTLGRTWSNTSRKANDTTTAKASEDGIIYEGFELNEDSLTEIQKASLAGVRTIAKMSSLEIHVYEGRIENGVRYAIVNGKKRKAPNGYFRDGNRIYLDINAGSNSTGTMLYTLSHEVVHYIAENSYKDFKALADFLFENYGKDGVPVDALINREIAKLKASYKADKKALPSEKVLYMKAYEEVVADSMSRMLADPNAYDKLAKLKSENHSLWQRIGEAIKMLLDKLKSLLGVYSDLTPDAMASHYVDKFSKEVYNKLQDLYVKAFVQADANFESANRALAESGIMVDSKTESATLYSVNHLLDSKQQQKVADTLAERFGVTVQEAKDWITAETSLASLILNPKYSQYLDYNADASEEAIKSNSDYPQGTVDFSNICKKRRDFTEVMNRVLRNFPNHVFAATDLAKIRTIMSEEGMEVACGICYVEDRRQLDSVVAQDFIDSLALYRKGIKTRPDGKAFNANQLKALKLVDGDTYTPSIYELISLEGKNILKAKNPAMEEAWVKFNNARGMQSVRLLLNDAEYKRQILKYSPAVVERKNNLGGLRIYSFSDMEMFHLIDIVQVITDSATVGLSLQGYTKVNEYARAVKDTGEKLNRSLIPKGDLGYHMEKGEVVLDFDTVEGIDINHPDFFDNIDNPNIGNIVIGINDTQVRAAMRSKFIDQIIPFHTGQSGEVLGEKGIASWQNYKDYQSERDVDTGKKSSHQINIYTEVIQAAEKEGHPITNKREFVEKFLEVCKANNLTPRFSQFLNIDENGDYAYTEGYHKFLVDFKTFDQNTGEYLPQMPVKPIFDNAYLTKLLKGYVKTQKSKDTHLAETMPKVLDRITKEVVGAEGDTLFSEVSDETKHPYSYDALISKDAMEVKTLANLSEAEIKKYQNDTSLFAKDMREIAASAKNKKNTPTQTYLHCRDLGADVLITKDSFKHGAARMDGTYINVCKNIADVLNNSIVVNELTERETTNGGYVLLGLVETEDSYVIVRSIVNKKTWRLEEFQELDAIKKKSMKKEDVGLKPPNYIRKNGFGTSSEISIADFLEFVNSQNLANSVLSLDVIDKLGSTRGFDENVTPNILYSEADHAPTFYSHMGKVIDDIRLEKMGAGGVVSYLKGKGVKNEEIKWSGIEAFLEGKKSVTKAELQEFVAGSQLQISEQMSGEDIDLRYDGSKRAYNLLDEDGKVIDTFTYNEFLDGYVAESDEEIYQNEHDLIAALREEYGKASAPRWADYRLDGGENYRELVFTLPNSSYSNNAMRGHWGQDAEGVLAHARIQDMTTSDGKKMLFVEEIQSDWHNEGREKGYSTKEYEDAVAVYDKLAEDYANKKRAFHRYVRSNEFHSDPDEVSTKKFNWLRSKMDTAEKRMRDAERDIEALKKKGMGDVPDAPFRTNYHEYVLKRLLRMAAEEGYDSIGWTPADLQSKRWSDVYAEGYRIEYDQDIPKFLRKYGKKWGAEVGKTKLPSLNPTTTYYDVNREETYSLLEWRDVVESDLKAQGAPMRNLMYKTDGDYYIAYDKVSGVEYDRAEMHKTSDSVWSMDITDSMKDSVLNEGQVLYSESDSSYLDAVNRGDMKTAQKMVDEAAKKAGYNSPKLYHGTKMFGFTEVRTSGVEKDVAWSPFFAANREEISATYVPYGKVRDISSTMDEDAIEEARENAIEERKENIAGLVDDFRRLIDRYFSPWVFGQTDNSYLEELVEEANPEAGNGDGVYDVLSDLVYDAFYSYQDEFAEYEDADDWAENSPEGNEIFSKIVEIEGEKAAIHSIELGEELGGIYQLYANIDNMYVVDGKGVAWNELRPEGLPKLERYGRKDVPYKTRDVAEWARDNGFDGVIFKNIKDNGEYGRTPVGDVYAFFRPESQIKSADPVTYDDNGNVIPLSKRFNPKEKDIRYSEQDPDSVSNRTLLANALESVAQNEIEKNKLKQYKEKIALIESEQAKLSEIRAKANELRFTKGRTPSETKQMRALDFEAMQIANRISTYDKQLLSLETTTALKGVLEREKAMLRKRLAKKNKEVLSAHKEREAKKTRELLTRHQESRKKALDSRHRTEMRHKIKKVVTDLDHLLRNGTKERNVKLGLQAAVASALEAVNMDTVAADERIAKLKEELMKAKTPEKIQEISRKIDYIQSQGDRMQSKLEALRQAYADIKASDENIPEYYRSEATLIASKVESVVKVVGDTPLRNMSLAQLESVYELYKMVLTTVRNTNATFKEGKLEDLHRNASDVMTELESIAKLKEERLGAGRAVNTFSWEEMIPAYAFERIGSKTLTSFFWEAVRGQNTYAVDVNEANEFSTATREKFGYSKWDMGKVHEFKLADGRTFRVTLKHMMSIYAYSKREQALFHMQKGGFFFNDKETFRREKGILKVIKSNEEGYCVDEAVLQAIKNAMTSEQIQYVDAMQEYLTKMGEKGNEVSRVLWGIDIFKEKIYFPLKSSSDFIYQANQPAQESSLKNDGMTKEVKPGASNPIVLESFDDVWANHVNRMSQYHAFVLPIENLNKILNYGTWIGTSSMAVSTMLSARFGSAVNDYLTNFVKDMNGASSMQGASNPFISMMSKFKKTAVAASMSVVAQQPTAILRALAVMDAKYFLGKPNLKIAQKWEELKKYAPIAVIKEIGGFDAGAGRQTAEWLNADTKQGIDKVMGKIDDATMMGAAFGDQIGWTAIWEAVKRETKATTNLKEGSEEFFKKAGERFTEVIVKTQVYDSTLSRSGYMRSKHDSVKMLTAFMGEPTVSINMMFHAVLQAKRKRIPKREAARIIGSVYASVVMASVASSLIYALRDDDDDESYLEKFAESFSDKMLSDINPLNMLPAVRDIMSLMDGWDVERTDMAIFKDIKDAFDGLSSENKSAWRKVEDFAGAIAALFGVPLKNTLRTGREIYNLVKNIFDGVSPSGVGDAFVRGITGEKKDKGKALYEAIVNGDKARLDIYRKDYKDDKAYVNAVRSALKENDPRIKEAAQARYDGDISEYTRIAKSIIAEGNFSQDDVVAAINAEINALKKGESTTEPSTSNKAESIYKVDDYYAALVGRDEATAYAVKEDIIRTAVANGKDRDEAEANFNSSLANHIREQYEDGNISDNEVQNMLVNYGGKSEEEASSKVQYWDFKKDYPDYDLTESAVSKYYEYAEPEGISVSVYYDYTKQRSAVKGTDNDGDGRTDSGSVKAEVLRVIDSLPITSSQKDAMYYLNGWSASTLWEAPWR